MLALEQAVHSPPRPPQAPRRTVRAAGHVVTFAVVTGLTAGTLVVVAALMGNL